MPRSSWIIILSVVLPTVLSGCFLFSEKIEIPNHEPDASGDSETSSGADVDTDTDTDTDTGTDTDSYTDTDTDTCRGEACLAPTDSDTDKDTCTGEACLAPTDSYTDADAGTDTDSDTYTDSDISTDSTEGSDSSDTDTDSDMGTDTEVDTCATPQTCADLGWECGTGQDTCGNGVTCPACDTGFRCADHTCLECNTAEYCGDECVACDGETPVCSEGACVCDDTSCDTGSRCVDGACAPCIQDDACGTDCEACPSATPVCTGDTPSTASCECIADPTDSCGDYSHCVLGVCETCGTADDACGIECNDCTATATPVCDTDMDGGTCVECTSNDHCRNGSASPFNSPLGICTPDKTCTCLVEEETDECTSASCPAGFACAQDLAGENHFVCLRLCDVAAPPVEGMTCEERDTTTDPALVWAPMTTCFAFNKFENPCSSHNECRLSSALADGSCQPVGSVDICTYSCWDGDEGQDTWCPDGAVCGETTVIYCE